MSQRINQSQHQASNPKRARITLAAASMAVALVAGTSGSAFGQLTGNQPFAVNDIALALNNGNATDTLKHVRADLGTANSGVVLDTAFAVPFIEFAEFDNTNGFRHNAQGNLLGLNFGTSGGGGSIAIFSTHAAAGSTGAAPSATLFALDGNNGTLKGRVTGLAVSPVNTRISMASPDNSGQIIVLDYAAGDGNAAGASITNYRSINIAGVGGGTRTTGTAWLNSNTVLAVSADNNGTLNKINVAADGTLTNTVSTSGLFTGVTNQPSLNDIIYEPTISPYIFVSGSSSVSGVTTNTLVALNATTLAPVATLDYSTAIGTTRSIAFDNKGNLAVSAFAGSTAVATDFVVKSITGAWNAPTLTSNAGTLGIVTKGQTKPPSGVSASFNGLDVAMTSIDYVNPDVFVNIGTGDFTQQYFGTVNPTAQLAAKLAAGKIVGTNAPSRGVGYSVTPTASGGTFRLVYTVPGDATLDRSVTFSDLLILAQSFGATGAVYTQGDFNYDRSVGFADLLILAQNFGQAIPPGALADAGLSADFIADWALAQSLAPEPTTLTLVAGLTAMALRRRRA